MAISINRTSYSGYPRIRFIKNQDNGLYMWVGYTNSEGVCKIEKQFVLDPTQIFYNLERAVTDLVGASLNTTHLFVAYSDSILLGESFSVNNPLTSTTEILRPEGLLEDPVEIRISGSNLWFLFPGIAEPAKLYRYNNSAIFQEEIILEKSGIEINKASSFTVDASNDLWVVTNEIPARYVRVFNDGDWDFTPFDTV